MSYSELPLVLVIVAIGAAWWSNMGARQIATAAARDTCQARGIQLLDGTVAFQRYGLSRDRQGRLRLRRDYGFEFSAPEQERGKGSVAMLGNRVQMIQIERLFGRREFEHIAD